ncbi:M20 family metallopeptidase [Clostridium malenominatum]|uniref:M20 family metallopeptidase n=1 Tax=Clostridium malenominatum TaxID=1539 RepID=A0ABP3U509_9CLOT
MNIKDKIMDTLLKLVEMQGIAGTEDENLTANRIHEIISEIDYFKENKDKLQILDVTGDPLKRHFVSALFCSSEPSNNTIVITGHLDVVDVEDFGHLRDLAFKPIELMERIKELSLNKEAMEDLESGDWIFGRGTADMKFGISLGIELLRELSIRDDFQGNILFLAVPGEESNSEGMIAAVPHLLKLKEEYNLEYKGLFVTECCIPKEIGDEKKRIYLGTSGKVMPLFLFVGKETHVYESHTGLNPNLLSSELNRLLELNPDFCDEDRGNVTPPPICLKSTDLKDLYSVQTPLMAASYYNILTLNLSVDKLMEKLEKIAYEAFNNAVNIVEKNVEKYNVVSKSNNVREKMEAKVLNFSEIYEEVLKEKGEKFEKFIEEKIEIWRQEKKDLQTIAINIMKETYLQYSNKGPCIIIGFAPPYYPNKHLNLSRKEDEILLKIIGDGIKFSREEFGTDIELDHYYMGLCDMSYTGVEDLDGLNSIVSNIIGINKCYHMPVMELSQLNIPSVVFGGLGKDFHKYSERVNISYSFSVVPNIYEKIIYDIFKLNK